jgi:hypothetical protein
MKTKTVVILAAAMALLHGIAIAQNLNVNGAVIASGNVVSQGGNIVSQSGNVTAHNNLIAVTGYVKAETYLIAGSYITAPTLNVTNSATVTNNLRVSSGTFALGSGAVATGAYSTAVGINSQALGYSSFAAAEGIVASAGDHAVAMGWHATASGSPSTCLSHNAIASGPYSSVLGGSGGEATAYFSTSINGGKADAAHGVAIGAFATAYAAGSTVVGLYNKLEGDPANWQETNPTFVVGCGTGPSASERKDAFKILKNGTVLLGAAQGDISMGEYGAP